MFELKEGISAFPSISLRFLNWSEDDDGLELMTMKFDAADVSLRGFNLKSLIKLIHEDSLFVCRVAMNGEDSEAPEIREIAINETGT